MPPKYKYLPTISGCRKIGTPELTDMPIGFISYAFYAIHFLYMQFVDLYRILSGNTYLIRYKEKNIDMADYRRYILCIISNR